MMDKSCLEQINLKICYKIVIATISLNNESLDYIWIQGHCLDYKHYNCLISVFKKNTDRVRYEMFLVIDKYSSIILFLLMINKSLMLTVYLFKNRFLLSPLVTQFLGSFIGSKIIQSNNSNFFRVFFRSSFVIKLPC